MKHNIMISELITGAVKVEYPVDVIIPSTHRFRPVNPLLSAPQVVPKEAAEEERVVLCSREATLPALAMVHGRMFITAWDCGLDSVEDDAVRLMLYAVEHHLKTILMAVFTQRHSYRLREGRFTFGMGTPAPDPYRQNSFKLQENVVGSNATAISSQGDHVPSIKPTVDQAEAEAVFQIACGTQESRGLPPVSLQDLYEALQSERQYIIVSKLHLNLNRSIVCSILNPIAKKHPPIVTAEVNRSAIQSHSVYAVNMERMVARFWHPSHEESEQEAIHQQEKRARHHMLSQQTTLLAAK